MYLCRMKQIFKFIGSFLGGIVIGLGLIIIIALVCGVSLSRIVEIARGVDLGEIAMTTLIAVGVFFVSLFIVLTAHEAGHLVAGLLSGYKFVSFRIFNYTIARVDGKLRIKRFGVAGTGGQCLLAPPEKDAREIPVAWYNAGGLIANVILLAVSLPLAFIPGIHPLLRMCLFIISFTDAFILLVNGIPMRVNGLTNDGYDIIHLRKNMRNKESMFLQLRANAMIQSGVRPKDMPPEWFETEEISDWKNPFEVYRALMVGSRLTDEMRFEDAYAKHEEIYSHKEEMINLYTNEVACELAFLALATGRTDRAAELLDKKLMAYIEAYSKMMSSKQRLLCAIAFYRDKDPEKALAIYKDMKDRSGQYLLAGEVLSDLAITEAMPGFAELLNHE